MQKFVTVPSGNHMHFARLEFSRCISWTKVTLMQDDDDDVFAFSPPPPSTLSTPDYTVKEEIFVGNLIS